MASSVSHRPLLFRPARTGSRPSASIRSISGRATRVELEDGEHARYPASVRRGRIFPPGVTYGSPRSTRSVRPCAQTSVHQPLSLPAAAEVLERGAHDLILVELADGWPDEEASPWAGRPARPRRAGSRSGIRRSEPAGSLPPGRARRRRESAWPRSSASRSFGSCADGRRTRAAGRRSRRRELADAVVAALHVQHHLRRRRQQRRMEQRRRTHTVVPGGPGALDRSAILSLTRCTSSGASPAWQASPISPASVIA